MKTTIETPPPSSPPRSLNQLHKPHLSPILSYNEPTQSIDQSPSVLNLQINTLPLKPSPSLNPAQSNPIFLNTSTPQTRTEPKRRSQKTTHTYIHTDKIKQKREIPKTKPHKKTPPEIPKPKTVNSKTHPSPQENWIVDPYKSQNTKSRRWMVRWIFLIWTKKKKKAVRKEA